MKNREINILGTQYKVLYEEFPEDMECDGLCDVTTHEIKIRKNNVNKVGNMDELIKRVLRHEIIHAFMFESGLGFDWQHSEEFGHDETTVDWFATQAPKIYKVYLELGIL